MEWLSIAKPRIVWRRAGAFGSLPFAGCWECRAADGARGYGGTPAQAYAVWQVRRIALGRFLERQKG